MWQIEYKGRGTLRRERPEENKAIEIQIRLSVKSHQNIYMDSQGTDQITIENMGTK